MKGESLYPTVSLESILCTEELQRRPSRPPDYEKENLALVKLVTALADSPSTIFHTLAETIQDVDQPVDHRVARRPLMGRGECGSRSDILFHSAGCSYRGRSLACGGLIP